MPLLPPLPEDSAAVTFDLNADLSAQRADVVDGGEDDGGGEEALRDQAKIAGKKTKQNCISSSAVTKNVHLVFR